MCKAIFGRKWFWYMGFWLIACGSIQAQEIDAFVKVQMSPSKVVEKQPIKVKVTAYSSTWFAEPLDFQNIQIPNAFILPFARTQSGIHYIEGKKYAGLEFFFLVFPYEEGEYVFPTLEIKTSIPPEGDYRGKDVTLKSQSRKFIVAALPKGSGAPEMVAKQVYISEIWSKNLEDIQVGDVMTRSIYIRAKGTLPSFISSLEFEDLNFASIYSKQPILTDERDDMDANGLRIEKHAYLFEKPGEFIIPAQAITWWNPYVKRKYEKELKAIEISVAENPDLGLVGSVKDSLANLNQTNLNAENEEKTWRDYMPLVINYLSYGVLIFLVLWVLLVILKKIITTRKAYFGSEKYYFDQLKKKKDLTSLYRWYDEWRTDKSYTPEIKHLISQEDLFNQNWIKIITAIKKLRRTENDTTNYTSNYVINP